MSMETGRPDVDAQSLDGMAVEATDGEVGTIRGGLDRDGEALLVVEVSGWIRTRSVLVPAAAVHAVDPERRVVSVQLSKSEVKNAPDAETEALEESEPPPSFTEDASRVAAAPADAPPAGGVDAPESDEVARAWTDAGEPADVDVPDTDADGEAVAEAEPVTPSWLPGVPASCEEAAAGGREDSGAREQDTARDAAEEHGATSALRTESDEEPQPTGDASGTAQSQAAAEAPDAAPPQRAGKAQADGEAGSGAMGKAQTTGEDRSDAESESGTTTGSRTSGKSEASGRSQGGKTRSRARGAGEPPIPRYDSLTAAEVNARLRGLTQKELAAVERYERKHAGRQTVLGRVDSLREDEPWRGYDGQTVADIKKKLGNADAETARAVRNYERRHRERSGVLTAARRKAGEE